MRSEYQNRQSFRALGRQFFEYGIWKIRVLQKHPRQMNWRHFVPPAFVGGVVICGVLGFFSPTFARLAGLGLALYALALGAASAQVASRGGWKYFGRVLLAFLIMHVAWGTGFWVGAWRFAGQWGRAEAPPPPLDEPRGAAGAGLS